ncbi:hypothetical protein [Actinoplanes siamensis]|uniref:Uncharacterized protein n=1 Tax=Actinoplanes siamensis TaxID=1223317 RepID=A0A919ND30_9ACTN|nr:hypothetical protein [Actinoplanes siamensis]GIF08703.1 hypothetical protein Asi03nite_62410 [Actinoplanes siamensis]
MQELGGRREQVELTMVTPPHEPTADERIASILGKRIDAAGQVIAEALAEQLRLEAGDRDLQLLDLCWDLQRVLRLRPPAPPVVPGRS